VGKKSALVQALWEKPASRRSPVQTLPQPFVGNAGK
jgi:hypothetical protein